MHKIYLEFCMGYLFIIPYLFIWSLIHISWWIFILYFELKFNNICLLNFSIFGYYKLFYLILVLVWHTPCLHILFIFICFLALLFFLNLQGGIGSSFLFSTPVLQSIISPSIPSSFYWSMVLETKVRCQLGVCCY